MVKVGLYFNFLTYEEVAGNNLCGSFISQGLLCLKQGDGIGVHIDTQPIGNRMPD